MVCNRCKMVVKSELESLGLHLVSVELGEVEVMEELNSKEKSEINLALIKYGFSLIDDKKSRIIEQVKTLIIQLVQERNTDMKTNLSDYISTNIHHDYNYISNLFTQVEGVSIEKYFIAQKIEKVKELLVYNELTLSEIAYQLNYSSVAHLSSQFKKVTGLTPSYFKNLRDIKRTPLEEL